ncbi:MAG TPA: TonB-dependent receptor [Chthoniobacterales bacterium]|nr:TonB-dependent receptor [Chthoniobacterales bacterium]
MPGKFTERVLASLAVFVAVMALLPAAATAQQTNVAAAAAAAPGTATPAVVQTAAGGGELQQITVTGYIIPRVGNGAQPVTTFDRDFISKLASQTTTDFLQSLPGAEGNFNPGVTTGFTFSPASASIALKGLLPNDTLTLVDGLRFPNFPFPQESTQGAFSFVDLNSIPLSAIDRIEILNDGGSATYGTDAIAGVVNLITKHDYNGGDISNYYGISQRGDDATYHGYALGGYTFKLSDTSKINFVAGIDYYSSAPIMQQSRPFTNLNSNEFSPNYPGQPIFAHYRGTFSDSAGNVYQVNPGSAPPITSDNFTINGPADLEFNDMWYQLLPRESRIGGFVNVSYEPTTWLKLYDSLIVDRNEETSSFQNQGIYAPSPFNSGGVTVPANNPYNPFGVPLTVQSLSLNEFGPFATDTTITTVRNVVGATVQLPYDFFIDGSFVYGESDGTETVHNNFLTSGVQAALNGTLPGHEGQFFNPFVDQSIGLSPNSQFYGDKNLVTSIWEDNRTDLVDWLLRVGGPIAHLDNGDLTVAAGYEYRSEDLIQNEDKNSKDGNVLDYQETVGTLTNGKRYLNSLFFETDFPIVGNKWSWPGLRTIDGIFSYRWDDYSQFGSAEKPKIAIRWKPFNDLTLRATYSEGFVAPSLSQLFGSALPGQTAIIDPKNPQLGAYTVIYSQVGNPNVKPENTYGYFVGGVWSPGSSDPENSWWKWANGFSAYFNWFQIDIHNLIGTLSAQQLVDMPTPPPNNFVTRDPVTTQITNVTASYLNLGNTRNCGIEFGFSYDSKEYNWGKLNLTLDASWYYYTSEKLLTGVAPNGAFQYAVENFTDYFTTPDFKLLGTIFYSKKMFGLDTFKTGFTIHYTDSEQDVNSSHSGTDPNFVSDVPGTNYVHQIGNWTTFDWQISYEFGPPAEVSPEMPRPGFSKEGNRIVGEKAISPKPEGSSWGWRSLAANTTITFGINNLADTRPPFSSDWYQTYDYGVDNFVMRFFYFQIEKKF